MELYLTEKEISYLRSLLDAQDPHDMLGDLDEEIASYEDARLSISDKLRKASK